MLVETARFLAEAIGPRPAGSEAERHAATYLAERLTRLGVTPAIRRFVFRGWLPRGRGRIELVDRLSLEGVPLPYTFPTPTSGICGPLEWQGSWPVIPGRLSCDRFRLAEGEETLAFVVVAPSHEARPLPNVHPLLATPTLVIGTDDGARLRALLEEEGGVLEAKITTPPAWEGQLTSANVVAELPGEEPTTIVLLAHYDSVAGSPGANDNASGVALLLRLIERLRDDPLEGLSLRFVFCGAEEPFLVGSRVDANETVTTGRPRIAGCLNLDMVGVGSRFALRRDEGSLWADAAAHLRRGRARVSLVETGAVPSSDQWAFHELGIPSAQLTREPDPAWHGADDYVGRYGEAELDEAGDLAIALLKTAGRAIENRRVMSMARSR